MGSAALPRRDDRPRTVHRNDVKGSSLLDSGPRAARDPEAVREKTRRLLELLSIYARQGHLDPVEIDAALGRPSTARLTAGLEITEGRVVDLETELRFNRTLEEFLAEESRTLERELGAAHRQLEWTLNRIASLERQLRDARRTTLKLVAASEGSLATLQKVKTGLLPDASLQEALTPLARDLERMTRTAQELQTLAAKGAPAALEP